jgi:splicing factor 3B subunit 3
MCEFHVGDFISSLHKTVFAQGGRELILYTTLMGSIGVFMPFLGREDVDFFQSLEIHMRNEMPSLCGSDHLVYRSFFTPCSHVCVIIN